MVQRALFYTLLSSSSIGALAATLVEEPDNPLLIARSNAVARAADSGKKLSDKNLLEGIHHHSDAQEGSSGHWGGLAGGHHHPHHYASYDDDDEYGARGDRDDHSDGANVPDLVDGLPYRDFGGGWKGWGTGKNGWGQWGSEWDWGNWANAIVPFAMPGSPPEGRDGEFYGEIIDASPKEFRLRIEQCKDGSKSHCEHPIAIYSVEGIHGGLRVKDGHSWSIKCEFPSTTYVATAKDLSVSLDGYAYNTPVCTEVGAGEPHYTPSSYIWSGDRDSYPDDTTTEAWETTTSRPHHRTRTHSVWDATTADVEETHRPSPASTPDAARPTPTRARPHAQATHAGDGVASQHDGSSNPDDSSDAGPYETDSRTEAPAATDSGYQSDGSDDPDDDSDDIDVLERRPYHPHTTPKPDIFTTSFAPDNFIQLTITAGKGKLSAACRTWKKPYADNHRIGGPGGWVGYGGWGGNWGESTREAKPTDTVTVYLPVTTKGHVTSTPTMVEARVASSLLSKQSDSSGSGGMLGAVGLVYALSVTATAVGLLLVV